MGGVGFWGFGFSGFGISGVEFRVRGVGAQDFNTMDKAARPETRVTNPNGLRTSDPEP